jgi:hypothetical protein
MTENIIMTNKYTKADWEDVVDRVDDFIGVNEFVHEHEMMYARARTGRDPFEDYESDRDFIAAQFEFHLLLKVKLLTNSEPYTALDWDDYMGSLPKRSSDV